MRRVLLAGTCLAILPLIVVCGAGAAFAQEPEKADGEKATRLDTLVITATRSEKPVSSIPGSVIIIGEREIAEQLKFSSDPASLIAKLVPGFSVANQTLSGASESFRGRNVLVMVDGVSRNTPLRDVQRSLSLIDLNKVERVEVVNGASSLYGSGATGGTINFITRKDATEKPTVTISTRVDAYTRNVGQSISPEVSVSASQKVGHFDYLFSASGDMIRKTYDGAGRELSSDAMLGQGGGDRTKTGNLYGRIGFEDESRRFEMSAETVNLKQTPDWFSNYLHAPSVPDYTKPYTGEPVTEKSQYFTANYSDSAFALGGLEVRSFYNNMEKRFPYSLYDTKVNNQFYYSGNPASPFPDWAQSTHYTKRGGVNATVETPLDQIREGMSLTWGLDYVHDETYQKLLNGYKIISPMRQDSVAAFAQVQVPVTDRFQIQAGIRHERDYLDLGDFKRPAIYYLGRVYPAVDVIGGSFDYDNTTFNIGGTFDLTTDLQVFGGFSQGYSLTDIGAFTRRAGANSTAEMCDAYGSLVCPGAGLPDFTISYASFAPDPQVVNSYEVGTRGDWVDFGGSISSYVSTSKNGVTYDVALNRVSQQKEVIWGAEATGYWHLTDALTVGTVLSYQEGRYDANGDKDIDSWLPNSRIATPFRGMVYSTYVFDNGLNLRGELAFFKGRDKITTAPEIESAALVNVLASQKLGAGEISFGVQNLFDTDYMNPTASATRNNVVNGAGRTISLGYKVTF